MRLIFKILLVVSFSLFFIALSSAVEFEFGGQVRVQRVLEENFALDTKQNMYYLRDFRHRSRLHAIARFNPAVVYFEIENDSRWGLRTNAPNQSNDDQQPGESGDIYINNVFFDIPVSFISELTPTWLRVGRQYFSMSRGLIIDRNSDDAPDAYDGAKLDMVLGHAGWIDWGMDVYFIESFLARPRRPERRIDQRENNNLYGIILRMDTDPTHYLARQFIRPYFFSQYQGEDNPRISSMKQFAGFYSEGELPYSLNVLNIDRIRYRGEYARQFGHIDPVIGNRVNYNGYAFYSDLNVKWWLKGGIEVKIKGSYHYGTGDNPATPEDETFRSDYQNYRPGEIFGEERIGSGFYDHLYGGERMGKGGTNIQIIRPAFEVEWRAWELEIEWFMYTAAEVPDDVSNAIGDEWDVTLIYKMTKNINTHFKAARFLPGTFFDGNIEPANEIEMEIKLDF
ncbi:MAG: alginate export family protein [Candidatus Electryonea clarkiae]|nr:alginate export family protein [Candidatus Electryonea clarkiae]MDP8287711.1 alginate export family protein [Candidatus Electryonea clarkiae]